MQALFILSCCIKAHRYLKLFLGSGRHLQAAAIQSSNYGECSACQVSFIRLTISSSRRRPAAHFVVGSGGGAAYLNVGQHKRALMRILTYKRTHIGDPDKSGRFGINDCMGKVRDFRYDAVIGVGGTGYEPRSYGIDRKINWVGICPKRRSCVQGYRAGVIEFEHFVLLDSDGPLLQSLAPNLAGKIYCGRRYILDSYSEVERAEAIAIIEWARNISASTMAQKLLTARKSRFQIKCRKSPNPSVKRDCAKARSPLLLRWATSA